MWHNASDLALISFILRLLNFVENDENNIDTLLQHPFMTSDMSAFQFGETINDVHMTDTDIIIGGREGNIYVVDIMTLKRREIVPSKKCHTNIKCIASFGQIFAVCGREGKISVWRSDRQNNQCRQIKVISCHNEKAVHCIRMNKNFLVSYGYGCRISIHKWNVDISETGSVESQLSNLSLGKSNDGEGENVLVQCAKIKTNAGSWPHSIVLQDCDLFVADRKNLKHYKLNLSHGNNQPEIVNQMEFTETLKCLTPSNENSSSHPINSGTRETKKSGSYRYFWVGTDKPGKIMKVDIETQSVLSVINVFEKGLVKQLSMIGRYLLCKVNEPKTSYSSCLCYNTDDLPSQPHSNSPSPSSSAAHFRQFIEFGEITSELCTKGDNHVFYSSYGKFLHLSLKDIESLPKQTTLRLHPDFD